jgi:Tol biopolymer transport system component
VAGCGGEKNGPEAIEPTGDAGKIVFSIFERLPAFNGNDACSGLWAVNPDGSGLMRLVMPESENFDSQYYPSFSPDASLLAFEVFKGSGEGYEYSEVSLLEGESGDVRPLATFRSSLFVNPRVIWSPKSDSALIVRVAKDRGEIDRVDVESRETETLVEGEPAASVAWAPDGSRIAYGTFESESIWLMDADGGNRREAVRDAGSPVWAPNSRRLAFFRPADLTEEDDASIWLVDADGTSEKQLVEGVQHLLRSAIWSPQGDRLIFLRKTKKPSQPFVESDFYLLELNGRGETLRARAAIPLAWSPDGKRILFTRPLRVGPDTAIGIYVGSAEGTDERLVAVTDTEDINIGSYPVWQPAGAKLVPATGGMAPRKEFDFCIRRLDSLRQRLSKRPSQ